MLNQWLEPILTHIQRVVWDRLGPNHLADSEAKPHNDCQLRVEWLRHVAPNRTI